MRDEKVWKWRPRSHFIPELSCLKCFFFLRNIFFVDVFFFVSLHYSLILNDSWAWKFEMRLNSYFIIDWNCHLTINFSSVWNQLIVLPHFKKYIKEKTYKVFVRGWYGTAVTIISCHLVDPGSNLVVSIVFAYWT